MPYNQLILELDTTGVNINNKFTDEPHSIPNSTTLQIRSVVPKYAPFFTDNLIVKNNNVVLTRNVDYQITELHQEATLKYGKEISSVILIINPNINGNILVTYQALGGHYLYSTTAEAIGNIYASIMNDNRPVDWSNVFNPPTEFIPTNHRHLLEDIYGFEPVVDYLERIRRAISLGQVNVILEVINSLITKFRCGELPKVLPNNRLIEYDALLYFLSRRKILNNIWVDKVECIWPRGTNTYIQVDTTGYPLNTTLYWEFYTTETDIAIFKDKSGSFLTDGSIMNIPIYVPTGVEIKNKLLYIGIKESLSDIEYKAVTYLINLGDEVSSSYIDPYLHLFTNNSISNINISNNALYSPTPNSEYLLYEMITG